MVWPFKRAPSITLDEAIADKINASADRVAKGEG